MAVACATDTTRFGRNPWVPPGAIGEAHGAPPRGRAVRLAYGQATPLSV